MSGDKLFLDTTIHIAAQIRSPRFQQKIRDRLATFGTLRTGLVVRKEFIHRLLKEAAYLYGKLQELGTFDDLQDHINRYPTTYKHQRNRKNICLGLISKAHGRTNEDRTDLLSGQLFLLLTAGLTLFDTSVDETVATSSCGCATEEISQRTNRKRKVEFSVGAKECNELPAGRCGIVNFLIENVAARAAILTHLRSLPPDVLTAELRNGLGFLEAVEQDPASAMDLSPCLKVGDILIAIESSTTDSLYTMNHLESRPLCKALGQTLIVRPIQPERDDLIESP